jgi:hypothetical protein
MEARLCNHCCRGKAISVRCLCLRARACIRARGRVHAHAQQATRIRHIVTSFVAPLAVPHFSTLYHKWQDFRKTVIGHKMRVFICSTSFVQNSSHSKKNLARYRI